ncbi:hypothetical protein ASG49_07210 [Marmoricola sp. Leaf446]|uniref:hypothetical protein n=1 Tax=Marmoricola sp. Leaf446 TaxID=1736379 RepID=UPI00070162D0|nr:hypothetical protein [Marmoricola sp. Leaf446]KQT94624.1 hypothetical protein ASG49_07210 [Marmoricola sp. Leaf446]
MTARRTAPLLVAAAGSLLLAGCGGGGGSAEEPGSTASDSPSASASSTSGPSDGPGALAQLGRDTAAGSPEEFGERDRCVNASDYVYLTGTLAGESETDPALAATALRRMDAINAAMVGQVPEDQTVDALATRRTIRVLGDALQADPGLDLGSLPRDVVERILPLQDRVAGFVQAQRADCEGEVEGFGTGLRPPV